MYKPMAFPIDLNETPSISPRPHDRSDAVSVCFVCRKEVFSGKHGASEEQRRKWKCFRCLLQNDGVSCSGAAAGFDINASPPREAEEDHVADRLRCSGKEAFPHSSLLYPMNSWVAPNSSNFRFKDMLQKKMCFDKNLSAVCNGSESDSRFEAYGSNPSSHSHNSNLLYLQTLREFIAEKKGVLGEGWRVEFEFCDKRFKTSAIYVSPYGSRFKSMKDASNHLGFPLSHHSAEQNKISTFPAAPIGTIPELDIKKLPFLGNVNKEDLIPDGFPIQFQDFCLLSAGKIDPRPSYHNTDQIWPVGYRGCWHDKISGSFFVFDVADGGECGPIFKVKRFPCAKQSIPIGSTILFRTNLSRRKGDDGVGLEIPSTFHIADDDDDTHSIITLLDEQNPPYLDNCFSNSKSEGDCFHEGRSSNSVLECSLRQSVDSTGELGLNVTVGEFEVEGRSTSSVWEMVAEAFVQACHDTYKQNCALKFTCGHDIYEMNDENLENIESLSRYSYLGGPINILNLIQNDNDLTMACEYLLTWLKQDRFGFDVDFVQEVIERLPGVTACSRYSNLKNRKPNSCLQSIGSGFLKVEQKRNSPVGTSDFSQLQTVATDGPLKRDSCPPGNPLRTSLPSYLVGDALQAWELAGRFLEVLGLGESFSFQDLESELINPWFDCYSLASELENVDIVFRRTDQLSQPIASDQGGSTDFLLANVYGSLLKVLVGELLSKVSIYACPSFENGESKSRRGKKKDIDCSASLKKKQLGMLPINELTWPEIARRYLLSLLSMEGNLDSTEIASRESRKVFHCIQGDGGILGGSLSGIASLEGDAVVLADCMKVIYGSLKSKNGIVGDFDIEADADETRTIEVKDGVTPEWAQVLEPVRKLPTNVGARIRRCVNEALQKNPPEWARTMLEHSISKEVYKGNASGPTKREVISVLALVSNEFPSDLKIEKVEKVKSKITLTDLIMKQCRIVLRDAVTADEDRVFCNLLGRAILNPNDDDEGLLGYPGMVSHPLDFRTIDLRLAAGSYCGSHLAFIDDVREVWHNIRTAYGHRSDLIDLAENLSQKFEDLYEKEVLTLVNKIADSCSLNCSNADATKERQDLLANVMKSSLPRAPWDEGICKVCGMDKDDDNVLLCDRCDSEYHRYCLNPPLLKIPKGNWYCPSCVAGQSCCAIYGSITNQLWKNRSHGEFERRCLESLARLANLMDIKEYWEFSLEERMFFMKFLFDEALNSTKIRNHIDQCASRPAELHNKLRSLTDELHIQKFKEEALVLNIAKLNSGLCNGLGDLRSDASSSVVNVENSSRGNRPDASSQSQNQQPVRNRSQHGDMISHAQTSEGPSWPNDVRGSSQHKNIDRRNIGIQNDLQNATVSPSHLMSGHTLSASTGDRVTDTPAPIDSIQKSGDALSLQDNILKLECVRNVISDLLKSITSLESELQKVSLRKDFLGRDSNGRAYWVFHWPGARPWIVANGNMSAETSFLEGSIGIPDSDKWMSYQSDSEIDKLVGWLDDHNTREKELKESILQLRSSKLKDSEYAESHILSKGQLNRLISTVKRKVLSSDVLVTKAMTVLEKKFGPFVGIKASNSHNDRLYRCKCLELLWHSKGHCAFCHQSFPTSEELRQHSVDNCKKIASTSNINQTMEDFSKNKRPRYESSHENQAFTAKIHSVSNINEQSGGSNSFERLHEPDCPFKFDEIMSRFSSPISVKDSVSEIGLIGSDGVPSFIPNMFSYVCDPSLRLGSTRINKANLAEMSAYLTSLQQQSSNESCAMDNVKDFKESSRLTKRSDNDLVQEGSSVEQMKYHVSDKSSTISVSKSSIVRESSLKPLVGRAADILKLLKTNLLDMEAALPVDAFRKSRSDQDRRCAWHAFVKSANTIYEMVQATILLEDTIKRECLHSDWWYWSSPSTAARITTLSALALRIYALDSAIFYEKLLPNGATEILGPKVSLEGEAPQNTTIANIGSSSNSPLKRTPDPEPTEYPRTRTRTRASKRRKG